MNDGFESTKFIYTDSLKRYITDLQNELEHINNDLTRHKSFINNIENRKAEITAELERLTIKLKEVSKAQNLEELGMDNALSQHNSEKMDELSEQYDTVEKEIAKLTAQKNNTDDFAEKMVLDTKIKIKENELNRLHKKSIRLGNRQRTMIIAKNNIEKIKTRGIVKQSAKVATAEAKAEAIQEKINSSKESDGVVSTLIEKAREVKVSYYKRKAEKAREILNQMDGKSFIKGARAIAIAKVNAEKLRNRINGLAKDKDMAGMFPPEPVKQGTTMTK